MCFRPSAIDAANVCQACGFNNPEGETVCQKCGEEIIQQSAGTPGTPAPGMPAPGMPAPGMPAPGMPIGQ